MCGWRTEAASHLFAIGTHTPGNSAGVGILCVVLLALRQKMDQAFQDAGCPLTRLGSLFF